MQPPKPKVHSPCPWASHPALRYSAAVLAVAVICLLRAALDPLLRNAQPLSMFFAPVLLMGWWAGTGPAILAALLGWFLGDWFFLAPRHTLFAGGAQELTTGLIHLTISAVIILVTCRLRLARAQAEHSQAIYRAMARSIPGGAMSVVNHDLRYIIAEGALLPHLGLSQQAFLGHTVDEVFEPEIGGPRAEHFRRALAGEVTSYETPYHGHIVWSQFVPLRGDDGHVMAAMSVAIDVTEHRQAEQNLRASEERLRKALSIQTVGVLFFNLDGHIHEANEAFQRLSGYSAEELRSLHWKSLTAPECWDVTARTAKELAQRGETAPYEKQMLRKDGSRWWGLFSPVRLAGCGSTAECMEFIVDITQRKHTQQALQSAKEDLALINAHLEDKVTERTAKLQEALAELERMSYTMVHDMRAPLRAMHSYATMAERDCLAGAHDRALESFHRIRESSSLLDQLITDALNYSKILHQQLPAHPTDLAALLRTMLDTYPNLRPEHADIHLEFDHLGVLANESLLTQCFANLLGNAVKFVAPGTRPSVRIRAQPSTLHHQPSTIISVEDNGIGIPKDAQQNIFHMFQRLHSHYPGTGIGLAIVAKAVERMSGRVGVQSEPGRGSRFWVELPVATE